MEPITGLAYGRIAIGALSLLSPSLTARLFWLNPTTNPQLSYMGRMFGSREVALGLITLLSTGKTRRNLVLAGLAVDAADAATGYLGIREGSVPRTTGLALIGPALGAVAAGARGLLPRA